MLSVICKWKTGDEWALILGVVREELDGIWMGGRLALCVKKLPHTIAAPVLFVIMRKEDFQDPERYAALVEQLHDKYPDEDAIAPILLSEEARMALEDHQGVRCNCDNELGFMKQAPTGWKHCKWVEVRFRETEQELVDSLEGQNKVDLR